MKTNENPNNTAPKPEKENAGEQWGASRITPEEKLERIERAVENVLKYDFDPKSEKKVKRYLSDIKKQRISATKQIEISQAYLAEHGHKCANYREGFIKRMRVILQLNPLPMLDIGRIIDNWIRAHAHRQILDKLSPKINREEIILSVLGNLPKEITISKYVVELVAMHPGVMSAEGWKTAIKRHRNYRNKKGSPLH